MDPDGDLVRRMLAPPPLEQARCSLQYWHSRRRSLPRYRRSERREADAMIVRWQERVRAAEELRYRSSFLGPFYRVIALGRRLLPRELRFRPVVRFLWRRSPRPLKLAIAFTGAGILILLAGAIASIALALSQLG
jgi:hypothetical protein